MDGVGQVSLFKRNREVAFDRLDGSSLAVALRILLRIGLISACAVDCGRIGYDEVAAATMSVDAGEEGGGVDVQGAGGAVEGGAGADGSLGTGGGLRPPPDASLSEMGAGGSGGTTDA